MFIRKVDRFYRKQDGTVVAYDYYHLTKSYCDAKGKLATKKLNQKVVNDPTRVDTLAVGTFTFPVAYAGLGDNVYPNLKITTDFGVFDKAKMAAYTRDFSIISILMRPVELEEFEATKE